jgi:dihydrodipicolinate synthase/N-acetylneuraminate lyase
MLDREVQLPILVYNNPGYQGYQITPELMKRLVDAAPGIFGAKLAMGTVDEALKYLDVIDHFAPFVLSNGLMPGMLRGIRGSVSPPLSIAPELGVELVRAIDEGRHDDATRLQEQATAVNDEMLRLMKGYGRVPYREGLRALGFDVKQYPRWPTVEMPEEERANVAKLVKSARPVAVAA